MPKPRVLLILMSVEGEGGMESCSLGSPRVAGGLEESLGAGDGTAGDRGC